MRLLRKLIRITLWIFAALVLIFLALWGLLQFPGVQNAVVNKVTDYLSEKLNTEARIERVDIRFFKTAVIEGVYIEDLNQDTLLYADELAVNLRLFSLFRQKLFVNKIELDGATINLIKRAGTTDYNYQFIIDAFSSDQPKPEKDELAPWEIELDKIELHQVRFAMIDQNSGAQTVIASEDLFINLNKLDLQDQIIDIAKARLNGVAVDLVIPPAGKKDKAPTEERTATLNFPSIPWTIAGGDIITESSHFSLKLLDASSGGEGVNFSDFSLDNLNFEIDRYQWIDKKMEGQLHGLKFIESSGFELKNLDLAFEADTSGLQVSTLNLQTPYTEIHNETRLVYDQFNDLTDFLDRVVVQASFENTVIAMEDIQLFAPVFKKFSSINIPPGANLLISGKLAGTVNNLTADNLQMKLGKLLIFKLDGSFKHLADKEQLSFDQAHIRLATSYENVTLLFDSLPLPPGLATLGTIKLNIKGQGRFDDLKIRNIELETASATRFSGSGLITGLPQTDSLFILAGISSFTTTSADLKGVIGDRAPALLDSLGTISYSGSLIVKDQQYNLNGGLQTALGRVENNIQINLSEGESSARYEGVITAIDFDLGKFLHDEQNLGKTTFTVKGAGEGLDPENIIADARLDVEFIEFKNYNYKDLSLDGDLKQGQLAAELETNDPNLQLKAEGQTDIFALVPEYTGTIEVDSIDFQALGFHPEPLALKTKGKVTLKGTRLDDMNGSAQLIDLFLTDGKRIFQESSVNLKLDQGQVFQKRIQLDANLINAVVEGRFILSKLPSSISNFVDNYYSLNEISDSTFTLGQNFAFEINLQESPPLILDLIPAIKGLDRAAIQGEYNDRKQKLQVTGKLTGVQVGGIGADTIEVGVENKEQTLFTTISIRPLDLGVTEYPTVSLLSAIRNDSIYLDAEGIGIRGEKKLATRFSLSSFQQGLAIHFSPAFILNDSTWNIPPSNWMYFQGNYLFVEDFRIQRKKHYLSVESKQAFDPSDPTIIDIAFKDYNIGQIASLIDLDQDLLSGSINGAIEMVDLFGDLFTTGNLYVNDLTLKEEKLGKLSLSARQYPDRPVVDVGVGLSGESLQFLLTGDYAYQKDELDLFASITNMELSLLNPLLEGNVSSASGKVTGEARVKGPISAPALTSSINLEKASLVVDYLKTKLKIPKHTLTITDKIIDIGAMKITGESQEEAVLSGKINHQFFSDLSLDLRLNTKKFRLLNTTMKDNPLFWGTLNLDTDITAQGTLNAPIITINAKTLPGSRFFLQPLYEEIALTTDDYIIFGNPNVIRLKDPAILKQQYRVRNTFGMDLLMNLDVTPDLELQLIVDPETEDKVVCKGTSTMSIGMSPAGEMMILGDYILESGKYTFTYSSLIKKKFEIEKGGYIGFTGNPMEGILDITAIYQSSTSVYKLIENEVTMSEEEERAAKRRSPVKTKLFMKGTLLEPEISFDIEVEQEEGTSGLGNTIDRKLEEIRNDPNQMNQQVFSLLLFNNFFVSNSSAGNIVWEDAGERVALNSVSKLISNQLNNLANRYIKGVEVSIDFESYQSNLNEAEGNNRFTELGVGLSKQLFNDRLKITAEADVGLEGENSESFSSIAGDFILEYKLTKNGNYLLRVFSQNDFNNGALNEEQTLEYGIGVSWKKEFGRKKGKKEKK